MRKAGSVQISCTNPDGPTNSTYKIAFADCSSHATTLLKEVSGEASLRDYLAIILKIHPDSVRLAVDSINKDGRAEIFHAVLNDAQLGSTPLQLICEPSNLTGTARCPRASNVAFQRFRKARTRR
jgi:hypothetical protein